MRKKIIPVMAALALIVIVVVIGIVTNIIRKYTPTDEEMSQTEYFKLAQDGSDTALILQNQLIENKGKIIDGIAYVDYSTVKNHLNNRFYWDIKENVLVFTTPSDVVKVIPGSKDYEVSKAKNSEAYPIVKIDADQVYIAMDFIQKYTNLDYQVFENPSRMVITNQWNSVKLADVKKQDSVRYQGGVKSPILTAVKKGDRLTILEDLKNWSKVMTDDGYIGYIQSKKLLNIRDEVQSREFEEPVYTNITKDYKINLVWHQTTSQDANDQLPNVLANTKGITTISPTWFSISDNGGNITSLASSSYVSYAHQQGLEVWGLVDNFSESISTKEVLSATSSREYLENQLIAAALEYSLDGINIDFENLTEDSADGYIQFIRELSIKCRKNGIVLSVDNPVPMPYTSFYNRKEQGIVADYVIIMGYDEHFGGSEKAGSVASLPFVRAGVEDTLKEVPAEKVINAVPFYTRIWTVAPDGGVTSSAVGMDTAEAFIAENGGEAHWSEDTSQLYSEIELADGVYKVWLEEERSIEEKAKLVKEHNLAGIAAWKLGFERSSIWDVILKYIN